MVLRRQLAQYCAGVNSSASALYAQTRVAEGGEKKRSFCAIFKESVFNFP